MGSIATRLMPSAKIRWARDLIDYCISICWWQLLLMEDRLQSHLTRQKFWREEKTTLLLKIFVSLITKAKLLREYGLKILSKTSLFACNFWGMNIYLLFSREKFFGWLILTLLMSSRLRLLVCLRGSLSLREALSTMDLLYKLQWKDSFTLEMLFNLN